MSVASQEQKEDTNQIKLSLQDLDIMTQSLAVMAKEPGATAEKVIANCPIILD